MEEYIRRFPEARERIELEYTACLREGSGTSSPADLDASTQAIRLPEPQGTFGRYRIIRALGAGGQGSVFLAWDPHMQRHVALKIMDQRRALQRSFKKRFQREAALLARVDHPNVCTVYAAGITGNAPYIAMRYVEGETLADRIARRRHGTSEETPTPVAGTTLGDASSTPLTRNEVREALEIAEKLARALHAAHGAGIVHRDLKPGNIIITPGGEPVILDFGLARPDDSEDTLTETGDVFGTPPYMSPQQVVGERLDARTDIWSLGVILWEMLTLEQLFRRSTRQATYDAVRLAPVPDIRRSCPGVLPQLRDVLRVALERRTDRRYRTAQDFAEDLGRVARREPILARPPSLSQRFLAWVQRNPWPTAIGVVMSIAIAGLTTFWWQTKIESDANALRYRVYKARDIVHEHPRAALEHIRIGSSFGESSGLRSVALQALNGLRTIHQFDGVRKFQVQGHRGFVDFGRGHVRIVDLSTGTTLDSFTTETRAAIGHVALHRDGRRAVFTIDTPGGAGSPAPRIDAWIWEAGTPPRKLVAGAVRDVAWAGDRPMVITNEGVLTFAPDCETRRKADLPLGLETRTLVSPDGRSLFVRTFTPGLSVYRTDDAGAYRPASSGCPKTALGFDLTINRDGDYILARPIQDPTRALIIPTDGSAAIPLDLDHEVTCCAWSPDGATAIIGCADGSVRTWLLRDTSSSGRAARLTREAFGPPARVTSVAIGSRGRLLIAGFADGSLNLWRGRARPNSLTGHVGAVTQVAVLADDRIVSRDDDGLLRVWSPFRDDARTPSADVTARLDRPESQRDAPPAAGHGAAPPLVLGNARWRALRLDHPWLPEDLEGRCRSLAISPDKVVAGRKTVTIYRRNGNHLELPITAALDHLVHPDDADGRFLHTLAASPDSRVLAITFFDLGAVLLFDTDTGEHIQTLDTGRPQAPTAFAWSEDGTRLAIGDSAGHVSLWEGTKNKRPVWSRFLHKSRVSTIRIDDGWLISNGDDRRVAVWNLDEGEHWLTIESATRFEAATADAKNGLIWTRSDDGQVMSWPLDPLAEARKLDLRPLTLKERERYDLPLDP